MVLPLRKRLHTLFRRRSLLIGALVIVNVLSAFQNQTFAQTDSKPAASTAVDRSRLETVEELSGSLANDLLVLSVAARPRFRINRGIFPGAVDRQTVSVARFGDEDAS